MNVDRRCGIKHSRLKPLLQIAPNCRSGCLKKYDWLERSEVHESGDAANSKSHNHSQDHGIAEIEDVFLK